MGESNGKSSTDLITVKIPDQGRELRVPRRSSPLEVLERLGEAAVPQAAAVVLDGQLQHLHTRIFGDAELCFLDGNTREGGRVYRRSLVGVLTLAARRLFPTARLKVQHSFAKGLFCSINLKRTLRKADVDALHIEMRRIVAGDAPFERVEMPLTEALDKFAAQGSDSKYELLVNSTRESVVLCRLNDSWELWQGPFFPSTSWLREFELRHYSPGFILRYPYWMNPSVMPEVSDQPKLFAVFQEYERWGSILGLNTAGDLSRTLIEGRATDVINLAEALHEKKIAEIAERIREGFPQTRLVLVSGPSASGKTTFTKRLSVQLRASGLVTRQISLDDYFVDRTSTPRDEHGEYDFEALEAIDVKLFNEHLLALLDGQEVAIPRFDFKTGSRKREGKPMCLEEHGIVLVEGIHGLNEALTAEIPASMKFKVYCSALTHLNLDRETSMSTTDTRLLRRLVRDRLFRGYSAEDTLTRWASVNRGEYRNIFPFQEEADVMFNSALVYEHSLLMIYALPTLMTVKRTSPAYIEARRLIHVLSYFLPIPSERIPHTSILREFMGGSSFYN